MTKDAILALLRHLLTTLGGAAAYAGYVDSAEIEPIIGGLVALAGLIWSLIDKKQRNTPSKGDPA